MASKGKQGAASAKGKKPNKSSAESKSEDVLQAVVLADSFQDRFKPLTLEKPRCLLPLANIPLIDYTLEFLAMNGVGEVYIYCGAHTDQVEDYIGRSRWSTESRACPFSVLQFVRVADARSAGDVLRDMDKRALVDGDFLLVHGDLVSNLILGDALAAHRKRKEANATNIMTLVLTSGGDSEHRTKTNGITPIFAIDTNTSRCLHYEEMNPLQSDHRLTLDPAIVDELSSSFELRADLIDPQIDICTPEVLALWSESFDYELPRRNFLHGILKDWELNGKMIYAEVVPNGYAARASNPQMYDAISKDVLSRWTFPFIPENNLMPKSTYSRHNQGVVYEPGVTIAHDAQISNTILGSNCTIGAGSKVINSILGRDCYIGEGCVVENSYLWRDITVGRGSTISASVIADACAIGQECQIPSGCLLSFGTCVSDKTKLTADLALSTIGDDGVVVEKDSVYPGVPNAAPYIDPEIEEMDDRDPSRLQRSLLYSLPHLSISNDSISTFNSAIASDDEDPDLLSANATSVSRSRLSSFASEDSAGHVAFHADAVHGLVDALRADSGDFDSAKLEFMGLRLANDASDHMMRKAVATAFARRAVELMSAAPPLEPAKAADRVFTARPGASKFVQEVGVGGDGVVEQEAFILAMQSALQHQHNSSQGKAAVSAAAASPEADVSKLGTLLAAMLQQLYALDILEEEGILQWWESEKAAEGQVMKALRERCRVLVEWLENASEEEEEEDDSSEEE